ncbi:MAG: exodeoxyribonuclease VII large subunit [Ilumatobacteraceae bacterium]
MSQPAFDFGDDFEDGGVPTYTVGELALAINASLRRSFFDGVWIRGEIQGWREGPNGHAYFNLVDDSGETTATIAVSFFANVRMRMRPLLRKHRLRLGDGMKVRIHGQLDFYGPSGRLGLKMSGIDPRYTLGELALARDELVRRLIADGVYDLQRALRFPAVPLRVGVVTSVGSAAWHDFTHELGASGFRFRLSVCDVRVQGDGADRMVAGAVRALSRRAEAGGLDVIVVVRGGGSRSDLAAFDSERIARAVTEAPIPVLTGLGHEIDRSVCDEVAHRSLKTPTACAGALIEAVVEYRQRTEQAFAGIMGSASRRLEHADRRLDDLSARITARRRGAVEVAAVRLDRDADRLVRSARRVVTSERSRLDRHLGRLPGSARSHVRAATLAVESVDARVRLLDPAAALARGWSLTRRADGTLVRSIHDVTIDDEVVTLVAGGEFASRVTRSSPSAPLGGADGSPTGDDRP